LGRLTAQKRRERRVRRPCIHESWLSSSRSGGSAPAPGRSQPSSWWGRFAVTPTTGWLWRL